MTAPQSIAALMTRNVISFFEEQTLPLAHDIMALKKIRHIPVVDSGERVVGIVTYRDILRAQSQVFGAIHEQAALVPEPSIPIKELMSRDVWTVNQNASAQSAARLLLDHSFSCLPVVDDHHKLVGIVTDRDFLKYALSIWGDEDA